MHALNNRQVVNWYMIVDELLTGIWKPFWDLVFPSNSSHLIEESRYKVMAKMWEPIAARSLAHSEDSAVRKHAHFSPPLPVNVHSLCLREKVKYPDIDLGGNLVYLEHIQWWHFGHNKGRLDFKSECLRMSKLCVLMSYILGPAVPGRGLAWAGLLEKERYS